MQLSSSHFGLHVRDLAAARRFYVDQLGLPVLQDFPAMRMFAVRAGSVRLSIFADRTDAGGPGPAQILLGTADLESAISEMKSAGVAVSDPPFEAPGFMRSVTVDDPDGNPIVVAEYLRDPLI